jgi:hypothetical protein
LKKEQAMPGHDNNEPIELSDNQLDAVAGGRQEQQMQAPPPKPVIPRGLAVFLSMFADD